jgi:hypothetical protein
MTFAPIFATNNGPHTDGKEAITRWKLETTIAETVQKRNRADFHVPPLAGTQSLPYFQPRFGTTNSTVQTVMRTNHQLVSASREVESREHTTLWYKTSRSTFCPTTMVVAVPTLHRPFESSFGPFCT